MEVFAAIMGAVVAGLLLLSAWLIRHSFDQDSKIAVLEAHVEVIREDIAEIKMGVTKIADKMGS